MLDKKLGRIDLFFSVMGRWTVGSLVNYTVTYKKNAHFVDMFHLYAVPLALAHIDLLFFHQVLEIVYFFVPQGMPTYDLFHFLLCLYQDELPLWISHAILKKIFLCKLLVLIGVYEETNFSRSTFFKQLLALPIDSIDTASLSLTDEKNIDCWLQRSLAAHPAINTFKTMHFWETMGKNE